MLIDIHASILLLPFVFAYSGNRTVTPKNSPDKNVLGTQTRSLRHVKIPTSSEFPSSEPPETSSNDPDLPNLLYELKEKLSKTRKKAMPVSISLGGNNLGGSDVANDEQNASKLRAYRTVDDDDTNTDVSKPKYNLTCVGSGDEEDVDATTMDPEGPQTTTMDPESLEAWVKCLKKRKERLQANGTKVGVMREEANRYINDNQGGALNKELKEWNGTANLAQTMLNNAIELKENGTEMIITANETAQNASLAFSEAMEKVEDNNETLNRLVSQFNEGTEGEELRTAEEVLGKKGELESNVTALTGRIDTDSKEIKSLREIIDIERLDENSRKITNLTERIEKYNKLVNATNERLQLIEKIDNLVRKMNISGLNETAAEMQKKVVKLQDDYTKIDTTIADLETNLNKSLDESQKIKCKLGLINEFPMISKMYHDIYDEVEAIINKIAELEKAIEDKANQNNIVPEEGLAAGWIVLIVIVAVVLLLITACGVALGWYLCKEHLRKKRDEKEVRRLMLRAPTKSEMEYLKAHPKSVSIKSGQTDLSATATNESKDSPGAGAGAKGSSKEKTQENSKDSANENSNPGKEASANETTPSPAQPAAQNAESPRKSAKERDSKIAPVSV